MPNYRSGMYSSVMKNHHYAHHDSLVSDAYEYDLKRNSKKPDEQKKGVKLMVIYRMRGNTWSYKTTIVTDGIKTRHEVGGFATKAEAEAAYLDRYQQNPSKSA